MVHGSMFVSRKWASDGAGPRRQALRGSRSPRAGSCACSRPTDVLLSMDVAVSSQPVWSWCQRARCCYRIGTHAGHAHPSRNRSALRGLTCSAAGRPCVCVSFPKRTWDAHPGLVCLRVHHIRRPTLVHAGASSHQAYKHVKVVRTSHGASCTRPRRLPKKHWQAGDPRTQLEHPQTRPTRS